jgi:amino acid transporter
MVDSSRVGQIFSFAFIALAAAGFLAAIFFPWTVDTTSSDLSDCVQTTTRMWRRQIVQCTNCGLLAPALCNTDEDWTTECRDSSNPETQGPDFCKYQFLIWYATWGLNIAIVCILGLSLVLYGVHVFGSISSPYTIGGMSFACTVAVVVLILFSVGLPIAIKKDGNNRSDQPEDKECDEGPCKELIGSMEPVGSHRNWTVGNGWIIFTASTIFLFFGSLMVGLFGRGGDEEKESVKDKVKNFFKR